MECLACTRHDSRAFYCPTCLTSRLAEHYSRRKQYRDALALATAKAAGLLQPPAGSSVLGVREESILKAEKWTLATRLRDLRMASDKIRGDMSADREAVQKRRAAIARRKENLAKARTLLDDLSSSTPSSPTPPPSSLSALQATQALIQRQHQALLIRIRETHLILTRELLSVYAFGPLASTLPLPSPFKSPSSSTSSVTSSTTSSTIHLPTFTLSHLPLPTLSSLPNLPPPQLSATLSHLLHLTRLLALYLDLLLPFTPLPSLFGPGRPGMRATPGWGEGVPSAGGPEGLPTWPLFLSRSSGKSTARGEDLTTSRVEVEGLGGGQQSGGREVESTMREREKRQERVKAVLVGAVALAFDLAWIVWRKGAEVGIGELDDLGALVQKAVGGTAGPRGRPAAAPTLRPHSAKFPLEFSAVVSRYTRPRSAILRAQGEESAEEEEWDMV